MGIRLNGLFLDLDDALYIPSEPIVRGSIQVSDEGVPTVLLDDHHTTGGYPKIATATSNDTDRLARVRVGQTLRFASISREKAIKDGRTFMIQTQYLKQPTVPRGWLAHRLIHEGIMPALGHEMSGSVETL
jgi:allophanate hydrolase subunit 2